MNVTFFIGGLSGGGAERVVCNAANYLTEKGHNVTVLTAGKTANNYNLSGGVKAFSLEDKRGKFKPLRVFKKMLALKRYIKKADADVYVAMLPETIKALTHYKRKIKAPVVLSERVDPSAYSIKKQRYLLKAFKKSDGAVFQTENAKNFYTDKIALKSFTVIPNAVNPDFISANAAETRRNAIVSCGRLSGQKRFDILIDAFSDLVKKYPDLTLEIYGVGNLKDELSCRAKEKGVSDKVFFMGFCKNVKDRVYDAKAFCLTSDVEGIPNALLEALALGVPSVATDCDGGGAKLLIENGVNGLLVDKGDDKAVKDALEKIVSDEELSKKLSKNALKISEKFSPEVIYGEWEEYLLKIISENKD